MRACPTRLPTRPTFRLLPLAALIAALCASHAFAQQVPALPVPSGAPPQGVSIRTSVGGAAMQVNTSSTRTYLPWNSFNIGAGRSVDFQQPAGGAVLNRVVQPNTPSTIEGRLSSNGRVYLVNPAGISFTSGSQVDVGGLVASTLDLLPEDFAAGTDRFQATPGHGGIVQAGTVSTRGGPAVLLGANVAHSGTTVTRGGDIVLAAASGELGLPLANGHLSINLGAGSSGGVQLGGTLDATGTGPAGTIVIHAAQLAQQGPRIAADSVELRSPGLRVSATGSITGSDVASLLQQADLKLTSPGTGELTVAEPIRWPAASSRLLTLSAGSDVHVLATVDATAAGAAGRVAIEVGQAQPAARNTALYDFGLQDGGFSGHLALPSGASFSTRLGSDGASVPYRVITSAAELQALDDSGPVALGASLGLSGPFTPIAGWTHPFDGLGNAITGLSLQGTRHVGLFATMAPGALVQDLQLRSTTIAQCASWCGGLAGSNSGGTVRSVMIDGIDIQGGDNSQSIGGLLGANQGGVLDHTTARSVHIHVGDATSASGAAMNLTGRIGGLVGDNDGGTIAHAQASDVTVVAGFDAYQIGGLVGRNSGGSISDSSARSVGVTVADSAPADSSGAIGGLVGANLNGTVARGSASGVTLKAGRNPYEMGGLAGTNRGDAAKAALITTSSAEHVTISVGTVDGNARVHLGGLVGSNIAANIDASRADDVNLTGGNKLSALGGLVGGNYGTAAVASAITASSVTDVTISTGDSDLGTPGGLGGLAGYNAGGRLANDSATGVTIVTGRNPNSVGGLLGANYATRGIDATVSDSSVQAVHIRSGDSDGGFDNAVGGVVGWNQGKVSRVSADDVTLALGANIRGAGGAVGFSFGGWLEALTVTKLALTAGANASAIGGLLGDQANGGMVTGGSVSQAEITVGDSVLGAGMAVGGLVGDNDSGSITASTVTGLTLRAGQGVTALGGLVGQSFQGTLSTLTASGTTLTAGERAQDVAGGVGWSQEDSSRDLHATGVTITLGDGAANVGGLIGGQRMGTLKASGASGVDLQVGARGRQLGGLVGLNDGGTIVQASVSEVAIAAGDNAQGLGGLVGRNLAGTVQDAHARAIRLGAGRNAWQVGGLLGSHERGSQVDGSSVDGVQLVVGDYDPQAASALGGFVGANVGSTLTGSRASQVSIVAGADAYNVGGFAGESVSWRDGGLAGTLYTARISGSAVQGATIQTAGNTPGYGYGNWVGGFVGAVEGPSTITAGQASGVAITAGADAVGIGGFAGRLACFSDCHGSEQARISDSSVWNFSLDVGPRSAAAAFPSYVGGFIGRIGNDPASRQVPASLAAESVSGSYAEGAVRVAANAATVGGFAGGNEGTISDSYATASVTAGAGASRVGGFAGFNRGVIAHGYADNAVAAGPDSTSVGAFVGDNPGQVQQSAFNASTTPSRPGIAAGTIDGAQGLGNAAMHDGASFTGWDFSDGGPWFIYAGHTDPLLRSFMTPATVQVSAATTVTPYNGQSQVAGPLQVLVQTADGLRGDPALVFGAQVAGVNAGTYLGSAADLFSSQRGYLFTRATDTVRLNITPAPPTVTANDDLRSFDGRAYRGGNGVVYSGLVNGESPAVLQGVLDYGGNAQGAVSAGVYAIVPAGLDAQNYSLRFVPGRLVIVGEDAGNLQATAWPPADTPAAAAPAPLSLCIEPAFLRVAADDAEPADTSRCQRPAEAPRP